MAGRGAGKISEQAEHLMHWLGQLYASAPTPCSVALLLANYPLFSPRLSRRKRMLFWSPDQLPCLYCYPDTHLLRRRSRVNVHEPLDVGRFPLFARGSAAEALLEPGDVVFFPSRQVDYELVCRCLRL